jgi:hypothetical protein
MCTSHSKKSTKPYVGIENDGTGLEDFERCLRYNRRWRMIHVDNWISSLSSSLAHSRSLCRENYILEAL